MADSRPITSLKEALAWRLQDHHERLCLIVDFTREVDMKPKWKQFYHERNRLDSVSHEQACWEFVEKYQPSWKFWLRETIQKELDLQMGAAVAPLDTPKSSPAVFPTPGAGLTTATPVDPSDDDRKPPAKKTPPAQTSVARRQSSDSNGGATGSDAPSTPALVGENGKADSKPPSPDNVASSVTGEGAVGKSVPVATCPYLVDLTHLPSDSGDDALQASDSTSKAMAAKVAPAAQGVSAILSKAAGLPAGTEFTRPPVDDSDPLSPPGIDRTSGRLGQSQISPPPLKKSRGDGTSPGRLFGNGKGVFDARVKPISFPKEGEKERVLLCSFDLCGFVCTRQTMCVDVGNGKMKDWQLCLNRSKFIFHFIYADSAQNLKEFLDFLRKFLDAGGKPLSIDILGQAFEAYVDHKFKLHHWDVQKKPVLYSQVNKYNKSPVLVVVPEHISYAARRTLNGLPGSSQPPKVPALADSLFDPNALGLNFGRSDK